MDRSRRCKRVRKDTKVRGKNGEEGGLSRMASTPIVAKKCEILTTAAAASPQRPKLPDLNLSRVEQHHAPTFSPCSPMCASPLPDNYFSHRRISFSNANTQSYLNYVATHLNATTSDNFIAYSNRMCRDIIRKRRFSSMASVRCSLSEKFSEVIAKEQLRQEQQAKLAKLDMEMVDNMMPNTPLRTRSHKIRRANRVSPVKLNGLHSPLTFEVDSNMNKAALTPNSKTDGSLCKPNNVSPEYELMNLDLCRTPQSSSPDELASPKPDSDTSPSKDVRNRLSQLSMSNSSCYAPVKQCPDSQPLFRRDYSAGSLHDKPVETDLSQLPFHTMNDSELRYIQACSSTVLAANQAREDSSSERLEKSINQFTTSQQNSMRRLRNSSQGTHAPQANGDGSFGEPLQRPQSAEIMSGGSFGSHDLCNYPSYRFCFEFMRHERLEDSRFGLIFATRNRLDGLLYCIKKSRGAGDSLVDAVGNMRESRSGPSFAEARQELLQEARALSALQVHENIVRYFSTWMELDCVYIQLEFCNGGSLKDFLQMESNRKTLTQVRTLQLLGDIGSALSYVHGRGMLHLDLTPGNILISSRAICDEAGDYEEISLLLQKRSHMLDLLMADVEAHVVFKLADFGRCRTQSHPKVLEDVGDAEFMPPEVFGSMDGEAGADVAVEKIDVFGLGLSTYYAMGGERVKRPEAEAERASYHRLLVCPPQCDRKLFRFVQSMVSLPPKRPAVLEILDYPGVCDVSSSRECIVRRLKKLQR